MKSTSWINSKPDCYLFAVLEKSKSKVPGKRVHSMPPPELATGCLSPCPPMVSTLWAHESRAGTLVSSSLQKDTRTIVGNIPYWPHLAQHWPYLQLWSHGDSEFQKTSWESVIQALTDGCFSVALMHCKMITDSWSEQQTMNWELDVKTMGLFTVYKETGQKKSTNQIQRHLEAHSLKSAICTLNYVDTLQYTHPSNSYCFGFLLLFSDRRHRKLSVMGQWKGLAAIVRFRIKQVPILCVCDIHSVIHGGFQAGLGYITHNLWESELHSHSYLWVSWSASFFAMPLVSIKGLRLELFCHYSISPAIWWLPSQDISSHTIRQNPVTL